MSDSGAGRRRRRTHAAGVGKGNRRRYIRRQVDGHSRLRAFIDARKTRCGEFGAGELAGDLDLNEPHDTAGVIAPPPLIALAAVLAGVFLDWLLPAYVLVVVLSLEVRIVVGVLLMAAGAALAIYGRGMFVRSGTNVNPYKPSSALVT